MSNYKQIFKEDGIIREKAIAYKSLPKEVKKLFRKKGINYVEMGMSPDLSYYRGYFWDKDTDQLWNLTGGSWEFKPIGAFVKEG